ncbi:MAG: hypothetical protein ABEJ42_01325 [Halobacteriaceae archaeon]
MAVTAGLLTDEPFLSLLGLFFAGLGYFVVTLALLVGMDRLRRRGSAIVIAGLVVFLAF